MTPMYAGDSTALNPSLHDVKVKLEREDENTGMGRSGLLSSQTV